MNAELHILLIDDTMIYYYYQHSTASWIFMERNRLNGNSLMFATQRHGGPNAVPQVHVCST